MALGGTEVGRVTVRVSPDLDRFREKVEAALQGIKDQKVKIDAETKGLREQVSRAVKEAQAGQEIDVPIDVDRRNFRKAVDQTVRNIQPAKIPVDLDTDRIQRNLKTLKLDNVKLNYDTTGFTDEAVKARQKAAEVLERGAIKVKIEAEASKLRADIEKTKRDIEFLERDAVDVRFRSDVNTLNAQIDRAKENIRELGRQKATPEIRAKTNDATRELAELRRALREIDRGQYKADVDVDIAKALTDIRILRSQLSALDRQRVRIGADVDSNGIRRALSVLGSATSAGAAAAGKALGGLTNSLETVGQTAQSAGRAGASGFTQFAGKVGVVGNAIQVIGQVLGPILIGLVAIPALATAIALAGAAITAAWGAISTTVAAIGPAIGLLAAPIGAVLLGMDGIKRAAKTIEPEFNRVKEAVSAAFEKGLTPAFKTLATLFPTLQAGSIKLAESISVVGVNLANMLAGMDKAGQLKTMFDNISAAVTNLSPGINAVVQSIILLASNKAGLDALVGTINTLGTEFRNMVQNLSNTGVLDTAFKGLQGTLEALSRAFVGLVNNGIRTFAAAAPGLNRVIDSITNFFSRFDYGRLGKAVSDVFLGLARAIDRIPPGVIDSLTSSFEKMGDAFNSQAFQTGFQDLIAIFDEVVSWGPRLIEMFGQVASAARGFGEIMSGLALINSSTSFLQQGDFEGFYNALVEGGSRISQGYQRITDAVNSGGKIANAAAAQVGPQLAQTAKQSMAQVGLAVESEAPLIVGKVTAAAAQIADSFKLPSGAQVSIPPQWRGYGTAVGLQGVQGLQDALPLVQNQSTILTEGFRPAPAAESWVPPQWRNLGQSATGGAVTGLLEGQPLVENQASILGEATGPPPGDLAAPWAAGTATIPPAVEQGLQPVPESVQGILTALGPTVTDAFTRLGDNVGTGVGGWATKVSEGMVKVQDSVRQGFVNVGTEFDVAAQGGSQRLTQMTTDWGAAVSDGFSISMVNAVRTGFTAIGSEFDVAAAGGRARMTQMTTDWGAALNDGFSINMVNAVRTGFTSIGTEFDVAAQGGRARITQMATDWGSALNDGFSINMVNAVRTGFQSIGTEFDVAAQGGSSRITAMTNTWSTTLTTGMTTMVNAVRNGFTQLVQIVVQALTGINAAIVAFGASLAGLNGVLAGALAGFAAFAAGIMLAGAGTTAALAGILAALAAFAAGVAAAAAAIAAAGAAIGVSLSAGMAAAANAVRAGVAAIIASFNQIRAALAAMTAAMVSGMAQFAAAAVAGMNRFIAAIRAGITAANAAVGAFRAAGANMGQALADGLNSKVGAVEAAAARLANAARAAAAAAAQIRSPSRVFIALGNYIGAGFAIGIDETTNRVAKQAQKMVELVVGVAKQVEGAFDSTKFGTPEWLTDGIPASISAINSLADSGITAAVNSDGFGGLEDRIGSALEGWSVEIDSSGMARMVNKENTRKARRR